MKTSILLGVALVVFAANIQAQGLPNFSEMVNLVKEKMKQLKSMTEKRMPGESSHMDKLMNDVAKSVMQKVKEVKDPKALQGFVGHLIHVHADFVIKHHHEMFKMMQTLINKIAKEHKVVIPNNFRWQNFSVDMKNFMTKEFHFYHKEFVSFTKRHGLKIDPKSAKAILGKILWAVVEGKDPAKLIAHEIRRYKSASQMKPILADFKKQVEEATKKSEMNLQKLFQKYKLKIPTDGLLEILNHMIKIGLVHFKQSCSVEDALKKDFNHAMGLMRKAFGELEPDDAHNMMEKVRAMIPSIIERRVKDLQAMMKKKGQVITMEEIMMIIRTRSKPRYSDDDDEDRRRHHHHHRRHHRHHHKMLFIYIFVPIGAILLISLVSVVIYIYCKPKVKAPRSSVYIEKPPPEKINPYDILEEKKPVSVA